MTEVDVSGETVIHRARERVSEFAMDPANAPAWYANIRSVEWVTPPPLRVGSRVAFVAHFLGRRLSYTYEVAELVPRERFVMRTSQGPFPMETSYGFESTGSDRTRMTLRNRGRPTGFARLASPFVAWAMGRENRKDLARLKSILEAEAV